MKVVHITTSPKGGAGIAAFRLHSALREAGISSAYVSNSITVGFDGEVLDDPMFTYHKPTFTEKITRKLKKIINPSEADKFRQQLAIIESQLSFEIITLPYSSLKLEEHPLITDADLVHLHWVGNILDYPRFFQKTQKPIVWTLHDMNPFKGLFHYREDETRNVATKDLNEKLKMIKHDAIGKIKEGAVVSPSEWLLQEAVTSGVFDSFGIRRTIANSIDVTLFAGIDREHARESLNLNPSEKVILFTAAKLDIHRKGLDMLMEALENILHPVTVITLGKGSLQIANKNVKVIPLGYMTNVIEIAKCYAAADAFVLPSREDNLPNTMLESLAAGTAVISFARGGMKEHITTGENGILVKEMSTEKLGEGLNDFLSDRYKFDREAIKKYAMSHFNGAEQAMNYMEIYKQLIT
ncbi:glycosyltransferase [Aureitalea sp. L0-47]|uniref:glycosyltransferase n=1 Tax=Aureitalea sp. L0-47 TaxID=2816962 RepID=UPI0022389815|nr:glycosyltransferase [Aureitalea sp. L0-47]MCW5519181.1 glycosyltransferase [Aureitalea sp. L0-47]